MKETKGFIIFVFVFVGFMFYGLSRQEEWHNSLIDAGRMTEGEVYEVYRRRGLVVNFRYFNTYVDSCRLGSDHTVFRASNEPKVGERYKVFYDENSSVLSAKDCLVQLTEEGVVIDNDYYRVSDTLQTIWLEDILQAICPVDNGTN